MKLVRFQGDWPSSTEIPVEYVVLHYTAETLEDTLRIFSDPAAGAGAHLVVSRAGVVHEVTPCWEGRAVSAPHAGRSLWRERGELRERFNEFSIGIEIVNWNGNFFPYTGDQYAAIGGAIRHLQSVYPALADPGHIVGHEQIAGWRGKVDPGVKFDWERLFQDVYPDHPAPERLPVCSRELLSRLSELAIADPADPADRARFWRAVSYFLEKSAASEVQGPKSEVPGPKGSQNGQS